jgi:23S rRNA maturation-related 3'-5' exoribonuclease YhaM
MENSEKLACFKDELELIHNKVIQQFAYNAIVIMPDYFFTIPSSSTGKYHAKYELGEGGLLRHTKAMVRVACELFKIDWWKFTNDEKDLLVASCILHDGWKNGDGLTKFTIDTHPLFATNAIRNDEIASKILDKEQLDFVCGCISSHSGQWHTNRNGEDILPIPKTKYEKFLHQIDYLCSRKCIEVDLGVEIAKY